MAQQVVAGAMMKCSFGLAPSVLNVLPQARVIVEGRPAASIMDSKPLINIPTFGMCNAPTNPEVIAATAAALGTPTPAPCVPATVAPWVPGAPNVLVGGFPALTNESVCMCTWLGAITIDLAGSLRTMVP
ncbi:DUF4280 domain-containing protein [Paraburkholderia sp. NMBU_R16]|uniref:DUF4280 domain-containing protein n=1 Tax=Paraburkholderia sp. NMBU_R16 TaxID=2698676 RepID=UPI0015671991|nr:DUF4280 domain-containing protein [Paraburkholderia sp. NMBU_R16]NRO94455.1 DUF4280 domain-containing protein [Paraburkholderia sp. NMBU_R16]